MEEREGKMYIRLNISTITSGNQKRLPCVFVLPSLLIPLPLFCQLVHSFHGNINVHVR
ncbi:hypothetical protein LguiA_027695 [Lonicera macranthoides]